MRGDHLADIDNKIIDVIEDNEDLSKSIFTLAFVSRSIGNLLLFMLLMLI